MKRYKFYIGIDISKPYVDMTLTNGNNTLFNRRVDNDASSLRTFISELKKVEGLKISNCLFGMEHTGNYGNHLLALLLKLKASIAYENSVHIKNSLGLIRGKNDKLDASRIAEYLFRQQDWLKLWKGKRDIISELSGLVALRERLMQILLKLKVPLKEEKAFLDYKFSDQNKILCAGTLAAAKGDIDKVENKIKEIWSSDSALSHLMLLIKSVPCVGELTALNMIIATNEFKNINNARKFACYAGVAPFSHQSGRSINGRSRVSPIANKKTKSLLHTCAVLSVRFVPELKAYFLRKTEQENKHRMLVYNAIRSKIILRVFSCVNNNRPYSEDYTYGG